VNRVAIAFLTKDRVDLSRQSILPLMQPDCYDICWCDGSVTSEGKAFPYEFCKALPSNHRVVIHSGVTGGPDAAVAYALTTMLAGTDYDHIGLCENDVLLRGDWFRPTMALFDRALSEGLRGGAVSARCYEDRVLVQRDGYAVMHNLGWGQVIFTREAAGLALASMRTGFTTENRRAFQQLSGVDIAPYWAFRGAEHNLCADWGNDKMLASHGLASLALTPSSVEMIGQSPPLADQGLTLAGTADCGRRDDAAFAVYADRTSRICAGKWQVPGQRFLRNESGTTIFPHQVAQLGGLYAGDWRLRWVMGFGPFAWRAGLNDPTLVVPLFGPAEFLVGGGAEDGRVGIEDLSSGFSCKPVLQPEGPQGAVMSVLVPGNSYREVRLTALTPGVTFFGVKTREPQPVLPLVKFDHSVLPQV
jgi:hypothetical protein